MSAATSTAAWAPLRNSVFRALWLAVLVSNIGTWMQTVGAQWLLIREPHASILVALVQTADTLPDVLFAIVGGVLADTFDRRKIIVAVQAGLAIASAALTVLTIDGQMRPPLLLTLTFILGAGSAFTVPAYQAMIPDIVPRRQLTSASALGSININLARSVGPAIAGVIIARSGVGAVFAVNTVAFVVFALTVAVVRPPAGRRPPFPERFLAAIGAGSRYVRYSPVVRRVLLRSSLFLVPATALWALLPLVASEELRLGAGGYGLLLGALGIGAIIGAFLLPQIRARLSNNALLVTSALAYAVALAVLVLVSSTAAALLVLLLAGVAWIAVLATMNAAMQLFLPGWVRARGLAIYQMVLFGCQAFGAVAWGAIAAAAGLKATFLSAAGLLIAGAATIRLWPLFETRGMDRSLAVYWPEPHLVLRPEPDIGPVLVTSRYTVAVEDEHRFLQAMEKLRLSRLRTGATDWSLYRDGAVDRCFVELFVVPSWQEHLRQHADRLTGADRALEEAAESFSHPAPEVSHLFYVRLPEE